MASTKPTSSETSGSPDPGAQAKAQTKCPSCGKEMAADQRYCLECGHRRSEPRVAFQQHLFSGGSDNGLASAPATSRGWNPLAAAALLGLLGIMLLVGVLIGKDENDEQSATTAPPAQTTPATGAAAPVAPVPSATAPSADVPTTPTPVTPGGAEAEAEGSVVPPGSAKDQVSP